MQGVVRALFIALEKKSRPLAVSNVQASVSGFEGDFHTHVLKPTSSRQILLISSDVLKELNLEPGAVNENAVIEGLDVMALPEGQRLKAGSAVLQVTTPCEPCNQMERVRPGLRAALQGRRGMFVRVVVPGEIHVGDPVELWSND